MGRETFRLVRAPRTNLRTLETLFAARREARSVAFQYRRRLSLVLRRLFFGLRVNSNRIARREGLFERFVELFVQGHRRFLASTFDFRGRRDCFCHVALHKGTSGISLLQRRCVHAITAIGGGDRHLHHADRKSWHQRHSDRRHRSAGGRERSARA
ncbi:protein of unknown function (plasmid) [Paraburkholderia dioscoreae]|uniref:Uncharacterized protein n=1 Tax=Paraburkholderia dioscoreae TaxID=2604047 RepID=A0A5Q4ZL94_9BURK|nr:protein of unknown function [Paraburkholderia dioscoreae]